MMLVVGARERHSFAWSNSDGAITTGSATCTVTRSDPTTGATQYLQSDAVTLSATPYSFTLTLTGSRWDLVLLTPLSMAEGNLCVEAVHSAAIPRQSLTYFVTQRTLDDIESLVAGAAVGGDIVFQQPQPVP